jgi:hypothetical protein
MQKKGLCKPRVQPSSILPIRDSHKAKSSSRGFWASSIGAPSAGAESPYIRRFGRSPKFSPGEAKPDFLANRQVICHVQSGAGALGADVPFGFLGANEGQWHTTTTVEGARATPNASGGFPSTRWGWKEAGEAVPSGPPPGKRLPPSFPGVTLTSRGPWYFNGLRDLEILESRKNGEGLSGKTRAKRPVYPLACVLRDLPAHFGESPRLP